MATKVINGGDNIIEQERNKKRTYGRRWQIENAYLDGDADITVSSPLFQVDICVRAIV